MAFRTVLEFPAYLVGNVMGRRRELLSTARRRDDNHVQKGCNSEGHVSSASVKPKAEQRLGEWKDVQLTDLAYDVPAGHSMVCMQTLSPMEACKLCPTSKYEGSHLTEYAPKYAPTHST